MQKLQVPYNLDLDMLGVYNSWAKYIAEVYFMAPKETFGSARQHDNYPSYEAYLDQLHQVCSVCHKHNINTMVLLNGNDTLDSKCIDRVIDLLNILIQWDLTGVIVANPYLANIVHRYFPQLKIRLSILSLTSNIGRIKEVEKLGYITEICLPAEVNRNEDFLKQLKTEFPNIGFSTIVNYSCRANCPMFFWHQMSFSSTQPYYLYEALEMHDWRTAQASLTTKLTDNNFKNPMIYPSELEYYSQYFTQFKLEDRTATTKDLQSYIMHYALGINPLVMDEIANNVCCKYGPGEITLEHLPDEWFTYHRNCKNECWKCGWCDKLLQDAVIKK